MKKSHHSTNMWVPIIGIYNVYPVKDLNCAENIEGAADKKKIKLRNKKDWTVMKFKSNRF